MFRYTNCMMSFAYDRYLKAEGMHWRDLFDMVCSDCHVSSVPLPCSVCAPAEEPDIALWAGKPDFLQYIIT